MAKKFVQIVLLILLTAFGVLFLVLTSNDVHIKALNVSLDVLLKEQLGSSYVIKQARLHPSTDSSGYWMIETSQDFYQKLVAYKNVGRRDDEASYFSHLVNNDFNAQFPLEGYVFFKGEAVLGKDTICEESSHCNLYFLVKPNAAIVYVGVSRT